MSEILVVIEEVAVPEIAVTVAALADLDAGDVGADPVGTAAGLLATHTADSTAVHGIADTALLETATGAQTKADAVGTTAASALAAHEADTTNVHGITNTALLETTAGAQAKVDAAVALLPDASTTVKGLVELATEAEAVTGTDTVRAVTPAGLAASMAEFVTTYGPGAVQDWAARETNFTTTNTSITSVAAGSMIDGIEQTVVGTGRPVELTLGIPYRHSTGTSGYVAAYLVVSIDGAADTASNVAFTRVAIKTSGANTTAGNRTMTAIWDVNTVEGTDYIFKVGIYGPAGTCTLETFTYPISFKARNH